MLDFHQSVWFCVQTKSSLLWWEQGLSPLSQGKNPLFYIQEASTQEEFRDFTISKIPDDKSLQFVSKVTFRVAYPIPFLLVSFFPIENTIHGVKKSSPQALNVHLQGYSLNGIFLKAK